MALSTVAQENLNNILTALDEQMQLGENPAFQAALKYYIVLTCLGGTGSGGGSIDISTLTKEATLQIIKDALGNLSNPATGTILKRLERIESLLSGTTGSLTKDWRVLLANETIPAGSCYVYMKVLTGDVTINGITLTTNEYINLEPSPISRHPEIVLAIPVGKSVRLVRGY